MAISKKLLAIVAVLAVVVVVIAAALALGGNGGAKDNNGDNDNTPAARTAENSNMKVVVTDVLVGNQAEAKGTETYLALAAGEHFVTLKFTLENKMSTDASAPALFWKLYTSDGQVSTVTFNAANTVPDGIQGGATGTFIIPFEVADGATPTKLVYDGITDLEITL